MPIRPVPAMLHPLPRPAGRGAHGHGGDGAESVDQLIARVARRLGDSHAQLPREGLLGMAEEIVLDTIRFVLHWVEAPASDPAPFGGAPDDDDEPSPPPTGPRESETPTGVAASRRRPRQVA